MKNLRKNNYNNFICEECGKLYIKLDGLSKHVGLYHNKKEYYDKYLKEEHEDICPICGNKNPYLNRWDRGYNKTCSKNCANILRKQLEESTKLKKYGNKKYNNSEKRNITMIKKYGNKCPIQNKEIQKKIKQDNIKKYGVEYVWQSKEIQEKSAKTRKEKYGAEYSLQSEELIKKIKETNTQKYGCEYPSQNFDVKEKIKQTTKEHTGYDYNFQNKKLMISSMMKKYGVENIMQLKKCKEKRKITMNELYGVNYPLQNKNIFEKNLKNHLKIKYFKNSNIYYQGLYELDFLEKYYKKYPDIQNGPTIKYKFNRRNRIYFPDFYIPSLNLIVEIKNSYLAKRDKTKILAKKKATITNGYNFIMITNKRYNKFNKLIKS